MAYRSSYNGQQVDRGVSLGTSSFVPTLQSAPTASTLTFTLDTDTVSFRIGMIARVASASAASGYRFYRLHNIIVTNEGTENETQSAVWKETSDNTLVAYYDPQQEAVVFPIAGQAVYDPQMESINILI